MDAVKAVALRVWEEVVGTLLQTKGQNNGNVVVNISGTRYLLQNFPDDLLEKLKEHRNRVVGIMRTDSGYAIRLVIDKRAKQAQLKHIA
jgi:ethanolamine utilization microcompartment shell protein EutL